MALWLLALFALPALLRSGAGQDTRNVTEPRIPATCKVLTADLTPHEGTLPDSVERHYRDTDRIEYAMRHCTPGNAVVLGVGGGGKSVFLVGPVRLSAGVTLVVQAGVSVWASRDPRNYDMAPGSCGIVVPAGPDSAARGAGCKPLLIAQDAPHAGVMGDGVIDARGGAHLLLANGSDGETWWELAHKAKVQDGQQTVPRLLIVRRSNDFTLFGITLRNSPNCHVSVESTDGFTAWGVRLDTPRWALNTDGIDPQNGSSNISIVDTFIRAGDDNISPKANAVGGAVTHMTVRNTHFYNGHGFGIGSQTAGGISAIATDGLSIDGSSFGLRIKSDRSRGGQIENITWANVCMRNVASPIVITPVYTNFPGTLLPSYRHIVLRNVHALNSGPVVVRGLDAQHAAEVTFDNVQVDGFRPREFDAAYATVTQTGGNVPPRGGHDGADVTVKTVSGPASTLNCATAFPPFSENTTSPVSAEVIPPPDSTFYVAADGTGDYASIQMAINKVPFSGGVVQVAPGIYRERVMIRQSRITLRSANPDARRTVLVSNASRSQPGEQALPDATLTVRGDDFTMANMTIANDTEHIETVPAQAFDARALLISGDRNVLSNVRLLGEQHTAYFGAKNCAQASRNPCEAGRTLVLNSFIAGAWDFIYGDGEVWFENSELHSLPHRLVDGAEGFVTAQGRHYAGQPSQFVFHTARLTAEPGVTNVFLGQPWRDLSTVIFLNPYLGRQIAPAGFRERLPASTSHMQTATFRIWNPTGPGTPTATPRLTQQEAAGFTIRSVLGGKDGWNPAGVP
jgi:polygalacturonase